MAETGKRNRPAALPDDRTGSPQAEDNGQHETDIFHDAGLTCRCFHDDPENGMIGLGFRTLPALNSESAFTSRLCYRCFVVCAGLLTLTTDDGSRHVIKRGDVVQIFPRQAGRICTSADLTSLYQISLGNRTFEALRAIRFLNDAPVFSITIRPYLESWMPELVAQLAAAPAKELPEVWLGIQKFLIHLHREGQTSRAKDHAALIESARQLLFNACLSADISFPDIAASLGLSYESFRKIFKAETGQSPLQYVLEHKFHYAQRLLTEGNSVRQTAAAVGYADPYVFSKQFKKYIGRPPRYYKRRD